MQETLPAPIARYFSGKNARDFGLAVAGFTPDAVVRDEGHIYRGPVAIRAWMAETAAKYDDRADVTSVTERGPGVEVVAQVSGNFPGSPAPLRFRFALDADRIACLEIGA